MRRIQIGEAMKNVEGRSTRTKVLCPLASLVTRFCNPTRSKWAFSGKSKKRETRLPSRYVCGFESFCNHEKRQEKIPNLLPNHALYQAKLRPVTALTMR